MAGAALGVDGLMDCVAGGCSSGSMGCMHYTFGCGHGTVLTPKCPASSKSSPAALLLLPLLLRHENHIESDHVPAWHGPVLHQH